MESEEKYNVKVLEKTLNILKCFTSLKPEWTLSDLCKELKMNRTTIYRILTTLSAHDFITVSEKSGKYKLGSVFVVLGATVLSEMDLRKSAGYHLKKLSEISGETAHLCMYYNMTAVNIDIYDSPQENKIAPRIGKELSLHASSPGKIFLANFCDDDLEEYIQKGLAPSTQYTCTSPDEIKKMVKKIRQEKLAYDLRESTDDRSGISAPIFNYKNQVIAAIGAVGPYARFEKNLETIAKQVKNSAHSISKEMGYMGEF
ncbi:HTH-type transcriptional regulator KipR [Oxobacter pfennigii]|uniref:HTH-type transcriptional regulator KipR n=1 Tax=Oxobacter pfennigii TaxID=36849 RepID=A0A0P8WA14_9CLOT|nr:IclR family transcriptional regulator [Oxobacter pfennigii]KPU44562.1 HTH-type transcriptional regulator KipR [Oxobacter pfennigii]